MASLFPVITRSKRRISPEILRRLSMDLRSLHQRIRSDSRLPCSKYVILLAKFAFIIKRSFARFEKLRVRTRQIASNGRLIALSTAKFCDRIVPISLKPYSRIARTWQNCVVKLRGERFSS